MRYDQLPAAMRAQVDAKLGARPKRTKETMPLGGGHLVCHTCGTDFPNGWGVALERHRDETGHIRYEIPLKEIT